MTATVELDRWQFERRLHHYVEYQYWEKLQRLRVSSGKPCNQSRRRSSIRDSPVRPRSQPALRHVPEERTQVSDKAFLRKVSAKSARGAPSAKSPATSSTTNCPSTKSVTFMLGPKMGEITDQLDSNHLAIPSSGPVYTTKNRKT